MGLPPYLPPISQDAESSSGGHSPATMAVAVSPPAMATVVITTAVVIGLRNQRVPCGCLADGVEVGRNSRRRRDADKAQSDHCELAGKKGPRAIPGWGCCWGKGLCRSDGRLKRSRILSC